jgi:hypothetical protein
MDERKGECQGNQDKCNADGCPKFGLLLKPARDGKRRIKGCNDPAAEANETAPKAITKPVLLDAS